MIERKRLGCYALVGLALMVVVAAAFVGFAFVQNRTETPRHHELSPGIPDEWLPGAEPAGSVRLRLDLSTVGVTVVPASPGEPIVVTADYDPRRYVLEQSSTREGADWVYSITFRPAGWSGMALLRAKLGASVPMLRMRLPRDVPLEIEGQIARAFAAMELGGLTLTSTELAVEEGAIKLSFVEPLAAPMERLSIRGARGSLSVNRLGNASPREAWLEQRLGAVDLDLRGPWANDARVHVQGRMAGGSLWLPRDVVVEGLAGGPRGPYSLRETEFPPPTLQLSISERVGQIVILD